MFLITLMLFLKMINRSHYITTHRLPSDPLTYGSRASTKIERLQPKSIQLDRGSATNLPVLANIYNNFIPFSPPYNQFMYSVKNMAGPRM